MHLYNSKKELVGALFDSEEDLLYFYKDMFYDSIESPLTLSVGTVASVLGLSINYLSEDDKWFVLNY
jgi:hypothetical protein